MTPDQVKNRLEALRWFDIYANILTEKLVEYDKQLLIRKRRDDGCGVEFLEMRKDFTKESLQRTIQAKEATLRFVKMYASEDDAELLLKHFFEGMTYQQMADEMHYSERNVTRIVTKAIKAITENAKDADARDFPY